MSTAVELTVTIRDEERVLKRDFLIYESFVFADTDEIVIKHVNEALEEFKGEPEDIKVKAVMVFK